MSTRWYAVQQMHISFSFFPDTYSSGLFINLLNLSIYTSTYDLEFMS